MYSSLDLIHNLTPLQHEVMKLMCNHDTDNVTTIRYAMREASHMSDAECRRHIYALSD